MIHEAVYIQFLLHSSEDEKWLNYLNCINFSLKFRCGFINSIQNFFQTLPLTHVSLSLHTSLTQHRRIEEKNKKFEIFNHKKIDHQL